MQMKDKELATGTRRKVLSKLGQVKRKLGQLRTQNPLAPFVEHMAALKSLVGKIRTARSIDKAVSINRATLSEEVQQHKKTTMHLRGTLLRALELERESKALRMELDVRLEIQKRMLEGQLPDKAESDDRSIVLPLSPEIDQVPEAVVESLQRPRVIRPSGKKNLTRARIRKLKAKNQNLQNLLAAQTFLRQEAELQMKLLKRQVADKDESFALVAILTHFVIDFFRTAQKGRLTRRFEYIRQMILREKSLLVNQQDIFLKMISEAEAFENYFAKKLSELEEASAAKVPAEPPGSLQSHPANQGPEPLFQSEKKNKQEGSKPQPTFVPVLPKPPVQSKPRHK